MNKKWKYIPVVLLLLLFFVTNPRNCTEVFADQIVGTRINPNTNQWETVSSELVSSTSELTSDNMVLRQYLIGTNGWSAVQRSRFEFYADFTNADTFQYGNYINETVRCCANPDHIDKQYQTITIRNKTYTYDKITWYRESTSYGYGTDEDISQENWGVEKVVIDLYNPRTTCRNCGSQVTRMSSLPGWLYIKDMRGTARLKDITVGWGDTVTITPEYSQYADHVAWAIRYYGESAYTLLTDGQKSNGMIVSGANSKTLTITNYPNISLPITLGLYIYDRNNQLPLDSTYPNTKYSMTVRGYDLAGPTVNVTKIPDQANGAIILKIEASDSGGLFTYPYSFNGGSSYTQTPTRSFSQPGKVTIAVKDMSGNITTQDVVIDAIDFERLKPGKPSETGNDINNLGTGTSSGGGASGGSGTSGDGGLGPGSSTNGNTDANNDQFKTPSSTLDDIKNNGNKDSIQNATVPGVGQTGVKNPQSSSTTTPGSSSGKGASSKDVNEKGLSKITSIAKEKADSIFDRIKNNSEDYLAEESVEVSPDGKLSPAGTGEIRLGKLEKGNKDFDEFSESSSEYVEGDLEEDSTDSVKIEKTNDMTFIIAIIVLLISLILLILMFILFFGVLVFAEKDDELAKLSNEFKGKTLKAIRIVRLYDKNWAINFGELLSKNDMLEAHMGLLFAYIYEGEQIKILTRFKGEKSKVIATESIAKIILVGRKRVKL